MATTATPLARRIAGYAASAGAALALASGADAQIVYTDVDPDQSVTPGTPFAIDFDGDDTDDFTFVHSNGADGGNTQARLLLLNANDGAASVNGVAGADAPYFQNPIFAIASNFGEGQVIGPDLAFDEGVNVFEAGVLASIYNNNPYYNFINTEGYVGFRFEAGGGTTHYGWARIAASADATQLTVFEYAFQATPDTPITTGVTVSTEPDALPDGYAFSAIGPNPVRSAARFTVQVATAETVRVSVYDVLGREVAEVFDGELASGAPRTMELNASALPAGTYVVRVRGESFETTRNVTVAR